MDYDIKLKISSDQAHSITVSVLSEYLEGVTSDPLDNEDSDGDLVHALRLVLRDFMNDEEWTNFINCMDTKSHPYAG